MTTTPRLGMTVPLNGPLHSQRDGIQRLERLGYTDLWSAEAMGHDGFTPLVLASQWAPSMRLGTAIIPVYTRGPALLASTVASMADAAPGRFVLGLGTSSNVIVENWNGIPFEEPYQRVRDTVAFLRAALAGEKITNDYDTFSVKGFRLGVRLEQQPPIMIAALREGMLRLAGRVSDGVIINWLAATDVPRVASIVNEAAGGEPREVVARLFVAPTEDRDAALASGRYSMAAYLNVPVYRAFHEWLGRTDTLGSHWERWDAGDRKGALDEIPESVVDELVITGSIDECRAHIDRYFANGVTTASLSIMPFAGVDLDEAIEGLAPNSSVA
jgi:probable F420-dependent oxidoreductase